MAIDLVDVGEELAELDLVVRQLEDGSLTVAEDDQAPDGERVRVADAGAGVRAWRVVATLAPGQASRTAAGLSPLNQAFAAAGGRGGLVVRGKEVRFEVGLDHPPPYSRDELQALYRGVVDGAGAQRPAVERVVAETAPTTLQPAAPPASRLLLGARPAEPHRAEPAWAAPAARPTGSSGGGLGAAAGILTLVIVGGGGVGGALLILRGKAALEPPPAVEPAAVAAAPAGETEAPPSPAEATAAPAAGEAPPPPADDRPAQVPAARPRAPSEDDVLADARDPARRLQAVEAWLRHGLDAAPGARRRMLEALGLTGLDEEPRAARLVLQSLRDRPPGVAEAIECLPHSAQGVRRVLVHVLAEAGPDQADAAAAALEALADTPDLIVEEALLRLGRPRDGAVRRLTEARGPEWLLYGEGRALVEARARADVRQVASLLEHADPEVRAATCALIAAAEQPREALALLAPVLRDPAPSVRQRAVEGLVAQRDPRASWPLARALAREESNHAKNALRDGLQRLPLRETVDLLAQLQARPEAAERRAAVLGLSAIAKPEALPQVVAALRDPDRTVRLEAVRALDAARHQPLLRPKVAEGLAVIRELALDRSDRELSGLARQLHYAITGRMPDEGMRERR
ncbi:MAG: HEAT repeat domain-containing protein [Planctomycetes bacterium]|nr:HEAT repeat domain-containing protein [Planctomycetota bacterium]